MLIALGAAACGDEEEGAGSDSRVIERSVPWELWSVEGRRLELRYEAGTCAGQRLTVRPRVEESDDRVKIAVVARRRVSGTACAGLVKIGRLDVRLREQLGDRRLVHVEVSRAEGEQSPSLFLCPRRGTVRGELDARRLIGLDTHAARAVAADSACRLRVIARDGRSLPHTQDMRRNRINVGVRDGTVIHIDGVY